MNPIKNILILLILVLVVNGCGGGGGGGDETGNTGDTNPTDPVGSATINSPSDLALETVYNISLSAGATNYYKFTTNSRTLKLKIDLQNLSDTVNWTLYNDAAYSSYKSGCSQSLDTSDCTTSNTIAANTTFYLKIQNISAAQQSFTTRLTQVFVSEGNIDTPITMTVGGDNEAMLGRKTSTIAKSSYYQFTTGVSDSTYTIGLTGAQTDVGWKLYAGDWNAGVRDCDDTWGVADESCSTVTLLANTTYNLKIENYGSESGTLVNVQIAEGGTHTNSYSDEGSVATPISLNSGVAHAATIAPGGTSIYQFTTDGDLAGYNFDVNRISGRVDMYLDVSADFPDPVDGNYDYGSTSFMDRNWNSVALDANRTFYLKVENTSDREDRFELIVTKDYLANQDSEGTTMSPVELTPGVIHSGTVGGNSVSRYHYVLPEAKPFRVSVTGATVDLSVSVGSDFSSIYGWYYCNEVFGVGDEICDYGAFDAPNDHLIQISNSNDSASSTYDILIDYIEGHGEGTQLTPVGITAGTPYASSLGASGSSYYQFTTGNEPASFRISITGAATDTEWSIRKFGDLNSMMSCTDANTTPVDMICETPVLSANTSYRLDVKNKEATATAITVDVPAGDPVKNITLDVALTAELYDGYKRFGYYKFTTNATDTSYTFQLSGSINPVSLFFYADSTYGSYTNLCDTESAAGGTAISCTLRDLSINTTYYLRTSISKNAGVSDSFDIAVLTDDYTENGVVLTLGADYQGKVASEEAYNAQTYDGISYYQFTTAGGGPRVHDMTLTGVSESYIRLYDDAGYSNQIDICYAANGSVACSTSGTLTANTTYYLAIDEIGGFSSTFTLNVTSQ